MAILINDNYNLTAPKPFDARYFSPVGTPWASVGAANTGIPSSFRYQGLTINIMGVEYWYGAGILDTDLVLKSNAGTLSGATNGLHLTAGGTQVALGGLLSGNTSFSGGILQYAVHPTFINDTDIIDKKYADTVAMGVHPKLAANVATLNDIDLSGGTFTGIMDGITVQNDWRVLVKNQNAKYQNGVYVYSAATSGFTRSDDFDATPSGETRQGTLIPVITGNTQNNTLWVLVEPVVYSASTQSVEFTLFSSPALNAGIGINITGSTVFLDAPTQAILAATITGGTAGISYSGRNVCLDLTTQAILAGALTGATNGLTTSGRVVELGGALTRNTSITIPSTCKLALGSTGNQVVIDNSAIVIGDTGFSTNYIYTSPTATDICATGELNLISSKVCVCGTDMKYDVHPTFTGDTQIVDKKYVDDKVFSTSGSTLYSGASPSTITVGWMPANTVLTGKTVSKILETILVKYIAPSFSTFTMSGVGLIPTTVEVGCQITGSKDFSFAFNQAANVSGQTLFIKDVSVGNCRNANACPITSPQSVVIATRTFASCGEQQTWCGLARDKQGNPQFGSGGYTVTAYYPYYWGLCTCPGPAGANRPVASCAMVLTGNKVLAPSNGSFSISFNSTANDYLWFAVPTVAGADKTTWYINPSNCGLIGGGIGAGCNLFPAPDPASVTTACWSSVPYKVYISNKQAIASGSMLIG
jgi:hypothetical protein